MIATSKHQDGDWQFPMGRIRPRAESPHAKFAGCLLLMCEGVDDRILLASPFAFREASCGQDMHQLRQLKFDTWNDNSKLNCLVVSKPMFATK